MLPVRQVPLGSAGAPPIRDASLALRDQRQALTLLWSPPCSTSVPARPVRACPRGLSRPSWGRTTRPCRGTSGRHLVEIRPPPPSPGRSPGATARRTRSRVHFGSLESWQRGCEGFNHSPPTCAHPPALGNLADFPTRTERGLLGRSGGEESRLGVIPLGSAAGAERYAPLDVLQEPPPGPQGDLGTLVRPRVHLASGGRSKGHARARPLGPPERWPASA